MVFLYEFEVFCDFYYIGLFFRGVDFFLLKLLLRVIWIFVLYWKLKVYKMLCY